MCYIPDLTERFPEGFGGVDMTSSYYPSPLDYRMELEGLEIPYESEVTNHVQFKIGDRFVHYGNYGGITTYTVCRISKDRKRICTKEFWQDVDGCGKRRPSWHDVATDEYGNEKFRLFEGYDAWISAKGGE